MIMRLKNGDEYMDIDNNFSMEEVDTLEKREDIDLEDTIEIPVGDIEDGNE